MTDIERLIVRLRAAIRDRDDVLPNTTHSLLREAAETLEALFYATSLNEDARRAMAKTIPCDTCGKPAVSFARDIIRNEYTRSGNCESRPVTTYVKAGCEDHPVEAEIHRSFNPWSK